MGSGFDLGKYLRNSKAVPVDDLPWDTVQDHPLSQGEVRFLQYMMNIETHTIVYLKELLSTNVIEDAEVTAFLSCWAYEEYFHGAALERFLKAYVGEGVVHNDTSYRLAQTSRLARAGKRIVAPIISAASPDFAGIHMTWGAAQEVTTLHGYEAVARQTSHPMLRELMTRIVKDERRHFAFYYNQAEKRLATSRFLQRQARFMMDRVWRPVGVGAMPATESDFAAWFLFRDEAGQQAVREVDAAIGQLPGMTGWNGLSRETAKAIARHEGREGAAVKDAYVVRKPAGRTVASRPGSSDEGPTIVLRA